MKLSKDVVSVRGRITFANSDNRGYRYGVQDSTTKGYFNFGNPVALELNGIPIYVGAEVGIKGFAVLDDKGEPRLGRPFGPDQNQAAELQLCAAVRLYKNTPCWEVIEADDAE